LGFAATPEVVSALAASRPPRGDVGRAPLPPPLEAAGGGTQTTATTTSASALHAMRRHWLLPRSAMTTTGLRALESGEDFRADALHAREASLVGARRAARADALPAKVTAHDPLALADAQGLDRASFGVERLRFPRWTSSLHRAARWVDDDLGADGKLLRDFPGERDALFSSFGADCVFREADIKATRVLVASQARVLLRRQAAAAAAATGAALNATRRPPREELIASIAVVKRALSSSSPL